jgi:hypothetical protein
LLYSLGMMEPIQTREAPVNGSAHMDVNGWTGPRKVGRPSTVAPYSPRIAAWLSDDPRVSGAELLRRVQNEGYGGGKSALYELIRRLRIAQNGR